MASTLMSQSVLRILSSLVKPGCLWQPSQLMVRLYAATKANIPVKEANKGPTNHTAEGVSARYIAAGASCSSGEKITNCTHLCESRCMSVSLWQSAREIACFTSNFSIPHLLRFQKSFLFFIFSFPCLFMPAEALSLPSSIGLTAECCVSGTQKSNQQVFIASCKS